MAVFVLDRQGRPLMPCTEKRARLLLARARARVHRVVPFVIRLTDRRAEDSSFQSLRLKLDPGSQTTGIALVREKADGIAVLNLMELVHRGRQISEALRQRRALRRRRRGANLRYRAPRFDNRTRAARWLAPSLQHRVDSTMSWVWRLMRWAPVSALSMERVRFDMQAMQNPDISGLEYQHCTTVQRADGYGYSTVPLTKEGNSGNGTKAWLAAQAALSLPGMNAEVSRANG